MKPLVIYHAKCTDGFGAAFAAWMALGDEASYVPAQYGDDNIMCLLGGWMLTEREVYILDFSFERAVMEHIFANAKRVVWLDHHKTAFEMWCGKSPDLFFTKFEPTPGTRHSKENYVLLDDCKSGAMLAWEYFHPDTEVPRVIKHIDDRDRWVWKLEGSAELHAALGSYAPWSFEQWAGNGWGDRDGGYSLYEEGEAILRAQKQHVERIAKNAVKCEVPYDTRPMPMPVARGLAVNTSIFQSEVGHELANASGSFGLCWSMADSGRARCSFRSNGDYDVSAIARCFGGGGHRNAAGCEVSIETLLGWLK